MCLILRPSFVVAVYDTRIQELRNLEVLAVVIFFVGVFFSSLVLLANELGDDSHELTHLGMANVQS